MNDYIDIELNNNKVKINRNDSEDIWILFCTSGKYMLKNPYWRKKSICIERDNYARCRIGNKRYMLHRIVYYAHNQDWNIHIKPRENPIDHIDNNKQNNHISNLRLATTGLNKQNQKNAKGYYWNKKRQLYCAYISVNGKKYYLGGYEKEADAIEARRKGKEKYHEW